MAEYLNCGNDSFKKTLRSDFVDKSLLLKDLNCLLNTESQYVCQTRPRRFGKSVNAKMINAYYSKGGDSKELFSKLKIAKDPSFVKE
ncbi:MAG: AAA family ATPase, partial [Succinivibrio sp.]|nr:AAA family ATPase [Succinivibrio sp.]